MILALEIIVKPTDHRSLRNRFKAKNQITIATWIFGRLHPMHTEHTY